MAVNITGRKNEGQERMRICNLFEPAFHATADQKFLRSNFNGLNKLYFINIR